MTWPEFATNQTLDGGRSWTAVFDSYDQYRELCYYLVKIFDGDRQVAEATAAVGTEFAGDDWTTPAFASELRARIAQAAGSLAGRPAVRPTGTTAHRASAGPALTTAAAAAPVRPLG